MSLQERLEGWARGGRGPLMAAIVAVIAGLPGLFLTPTVDRDEPRFAQATAQMLESGDFVSPRFQDQPRFKKPVGIYWLQAASVTLVSHVEDREIWAYRLPSLLGAALAAAHTGTAVRVRLNRDQDMMLTGKRHPFLARFEVGYDGGGRILAARIALISNGGWSLDLSLPVTDRAVFHLDNAYYLPAVEFSGQVAKTNLASNTAFRGFGGQFSAQLGALGRRSPHKAHRWRLVARGREGQVVFRQVVGLDHLAQHAREFLVRGV